MSTVHPTAVVADGARLGKDVVVGPYCVIGNQVQVGDGVWLKAHVVIDGATMIGPECRVFPFATLGTQTQDLKYCGGEPRVEIGARTTIREYVTVNAATVDGQTTVVGCDCLLMAGCHVAHNCHLGAGVIMANGSGLAGDVHVGEGAVIGGLCGVHQFVRIGSRSFCGGCSKIVKDVPPFMLADGNPARIHGLNRVGLRRRGMPDSSMQCLRQVFRILYREGLTLKAAVSKIESTWGGQLEVDELLAFIDGTMRGITRPGSPRRADGSCRNPAGLAR